MNVILRVAPVPVAVVVVFIFSDEMSGPQSNKDLNCVILAFIVTFQLNSCHFSFIFIVPKVVLSPKRWSFCHPVAGWIGSTGEMGLSELGLSGLFSRPKF